MASRKRKANSRVESLRAEVARAERLVGEKLRRLEKNEGIRDTMSIDPRMVSGMRIARKDPTRYNTKQLESYLAQLNRFKSRSTRFVADRRGRPVPADVYARYLKAERRLNAAKVREFEKVKDIPAPWAGTKSVTKRGRTRSEPMTVEDRLFRTTPGLDPRAKVPLKFKHIAPTSFDSIEKMEQMADSFLKRSSRQSRAEKLKADRERAMKMADRMLDRGLVEALDSLTDKQFSLAWNFSSLIDEMTDKYTEMVARYRTTRPDDFETDVMDFSHIHEIIEWAKSSGV